MREVNTRLRIDCFRLSEMAPPAPCSESISSRNPRMGSASSLTLTGRVIAEELLQEFELPLVAERSLTFQRGLPGLLEVRAA